MWIFPVSDWNQSNNEDLTATSYIYLGEKIEEQCRKASIIPSPMRHTVDKNTVFEVKTLLKKKKEKTVTLPLSD